MAMFNAEVTCTHYYKKTVEANSRTDAQKKIEESFISEIGSWDEIKAPDVFVLHIAKL